MSDNRERGEILFVKPALSREEAIKRLALRSFLPPFSKVRMEKVEITYLPHYLFAIKVEWKGREEVVEAAADAILGHFALWRPEHAKLEPAPGVEFELPFFLAREEARERLIREYRWVLISTALKLRRRFKVREVLPGPRMYYPFWTGYYRSRKRWNLEVADALTGMRQGGKVRDSILAAWMSRETKAQTAGPDT